MPQVTPPACTWGVSWEWLAWWWGECRGEGQAAELAQAYRVMDGCVDGSWHKKVMQTLGRLRMRYSGSHPWPFPVLPWAGWDDSCSSQALPCALAQVFLCHEETVFPTGRSLHQHITSLHSFLKDTLSLKRKITFVAFGVRIHSLAHLCPSENCSSNPEETGFGLSQLPEGTLLSSCQNAPYAHSSSSRDFLEWLLWWCSLWLTDHWVPGVEPGCGPVLRSHEAPWTRTQVRDREQDTFIIFSFSKAYCIIFKAHL